MKPAIEPRSAWRARLAAMPKAQLALIALLPVLVFVWLPLLGAGDAPPPAAVPQAPVAAVPPDASPAPAGETAAAVAADAVAATAQLVARLRTLTAPHQPRWTPAAGEPFGGAPASVLVTVADAASSELVPTAIVLSKGAPPIAIVGGRTCGVGDAVAGRIIVAIEERRVVYRAGDSTFAVAMPMPAIGGGR